MLQFYSLYTVICNSKNPFLGKDFFIVGGGNSVDHRLSEVLPADMTICINSSFKVFGNAFALFWTDSSWFRENAQAVKDSKIPNKYFIHSNKPSILPSDCNWLPLKSIKCEYYSKYRFTEHVVGNNTGCSTINYLDKMGARTLYLLGFDCVQVGGKSHFHNDYTSVMKDERYADTFIPCFKHLYDNLRQVKIINCSPYSQLKFFKHRHIDMVLKDLNIKRIERT